MIKTNSSNPSNRIVYLDYLRVISTIFIVILHFSTYGLYFVEASSYEGIVMNSYLELTTFALPMFIMISGSLFLSKDISIKTIYIKYVFRLLIFFVFWSLFYSLFYRLIQIILQKPVTFDLTDIFADAISRPYQLWFIPMILGLYMLSPILRAICKNMTILRYTILISLILGYVMPQVINSFLIPAISGIDNGVISFISYFYQHIDISPITGNLFMFIFGYYLSKESFSIPSRIIIYICGFSGLILLVLSNIFPIKLPFIGLINLLFFSALFLIFRYKSYHNTRLCLVISSLSKLCTGTFALHVFYMDVLFSIFGLYALSFNPLFSIPVLTIVVVALSFLTTWIIGKIPILNRYLC